MTPEESKIGGFFAIDRRTWERVCGLGLNPAVAYLVLARGTARNNRTTAWSVQAIENHTGVSRGRGKKATEVLIESGVVKRLRAGSVPQYDLLPWAEQGGSLPCRQHLSKRQQRVLETVSSSTPVKDHDRNIAKALVRSGHLEQADDGSHTICRRPEDQPDWIWLPNELVTGASGEIPPVELVRQCQDPMTLRMLVDFYHAQNLREDGGVSRGITWQEFDRFELKRHSRFTVWGFRFKAAWVRRTGPAECHYRPEGDKKDAAVDFFRRQTQLAQLGLVEWMPWLVESDLDDAELIHPVGLGKSDGLEDCLGLAAHEAGASMLTPAQLALANDSHFAMVPVPRHIANVQLVGIARLRYRPRTKAAAAWWADMHQTCRRHLAQYRELADEGQDRGCNIKGNQRGLKWASRLRQRSY